jgi:hypothetical protein
LTCPTRPGCQTYLPSHDGQGSANQTTSRLPQARRRCFQAGRRDARPSDACHTDSLRRSAGRASSSRPASAPWCGADQASGSPPHRRVPKVPRTQRLTWHSWVRWLSSTAGGVEWPAWLGTNPRCRPSARLSAAPAKERSQAAAPMEICPRGRWPSA